MPSVKFFVHPQYYKNVGFRNSIFSTGCKFLQGAPIVLYFFLGRVLEGEFISTEGHWDWKGGSQLNFRWPLLGAGPY